MYASELQEIADRHGVAFHSFADDSMSVCTEDVHAAEQAVIDCVLDIQQWSILTSSQAECGDIGSHLAWHATIVSQAMLLSLFLCYSLLI